MMCAKETSKTVLHGKSYTAYVYAVIISLALVVLVIKSVDGVRGTDQYWYTSDTATLIDNKPPITNFRFPGMLLRENIADPVTHFVHNGPLLYINKYLGKWLNNSAVRAWKYSNMLWWLGATLFIFFLLAKLVDSGTAVLGALLYLTTPIVLWQTANFLQEIWLGFLAAVFLFAVGTLRHARLMSYCFMMPLVFISAVSHPFFLLMSLYLIFVSVFYRKNIFLTVCLGVALMLALFSKDILFPSSFPPDIQAITTSAIPGKTNLHWQFDDNPIPVTTELIKAKLADAVKKQFLTPAAMPMTVVVNAGLLAIFALLLIRKFRVDTVICFSVFSVGAWGAMVVLLQNQARYQLLIMPAIITCIVMLLHELHRPKLRKYLLIATSAVFLVADVYLLSIIKSDIQVGKSLNQVVTDSITSLPSDKRYAVIDKERSVMKLVISRLDPAPGLMIDPRYIQKENLEKVLALYRPDYVLTSTPELLETVDLTLEALHQSSQAESGHQLHIYSVNPHN